MIGHCGRHRPIARRCRRCSRCHAGDRHGTARRGCIGCPTRTRIGRIRATSKPLRVICTNTFRIVVSRCERACLFRDRSRLVESGTLLVARAARRRRTISNRSSRADHRPVRRDDASVRLHVKVSARGESRDHAANEHRQSLPRRFALGLGRQVARLGKTRVGRHHPATNETRQPARIAQIGDVELPWHRRGGSGGRGRRGCNGRDRIGSRREDRALPIGPARRARFFFCARNGVTAAANHRIERQRIFWSVHVAPYWSYGPTHGAGGSRHRNS